MPRRPAKLPLQVMPPADISALGLRPGACIEYRTRRFMPEDPPRVCTVEEVKPNGTLVLADGLWLRRQDLVWLRPHPVTLASDHAGEASPPEAAGHESPPSPASHPSPASASPPPADSATRPRRGKGKRHGRRLPDATVDLWLEAVKACRCHQLAGLKFPAAVAATAADPRFAGLKINPPNVSWWSTRFVHAGRLDRTRIARGRLCRPRARRSAGPALVSLPPFGGADEPCASPAHASGGDAAATQAPPASPAGSAAGRMPEGSGESATPRPPEASPSASLSDLAKRLRGYAELLDQGAELASRAAMALVVLDADPQAGE